jgi:hypothetical protein
MRNSLVLLFVVVSFGVIAQRKKDNDTCFVVPSLLSKTSNDSLRIQSRCDLAEFTFELVDQWSLPVYESSEFTEPLDLDINQKIGKNQETDKYQSGIYYWRISYRRLDQTKMRELIGILEIQ